MHIDSQLMSSSLSSTTTIVSDRWLDLPDDVLNMIVHHLHDPIDFINFGAVCHTWRSSFLTHRLSCRNIHCHHASFDLPWMFFLPPTKNGSELSSPLHFYCPTNNKSYHVHLPSRLLATTDANFTFRFSSNGFLVYRRNDQSSLHLVINPLTGIHFTLPSASTVVKRKCSCSTYNFIDKAIIDKRSYSVAIICDRHSQVMFAKPGDDYWTSFPDFELQDFIDIDDIIFHNGVLYVVTEFGTTYKFDLDLGASGPPTVKHAPRTNIRYSQNGRYVKYKDDEGTNYHFVESSDGVHLFLLRYTSYGLEGRVEFVLFEDNKTEGKWDEVLLQRLEDRSRLLVFNTILSLGGSQCNDLVGNQAVYNVLSDHGNIRWFDPPADLLQTPHCWFTPICFDFSIIQAPGTIDWSKLPEDILNLIIHRLNDLIDFLNFGVACRSWRSAAQTHHIYCHDLNCRHRSSKIPWLLLHSPTNHNHNLHCPLHVYDFTNRKSYHIQLPPNSFTNSEVKFSSNGYLICEQKQNSSSYHVVNPLTGTHFSLPLTSSTINDVVIDQKSRYVVVICDSRSRIMFSKFNDCSNWTLLSSNIYLHNSDCFSRIIMHNRMLYAITESGTTYLFDLNLCLSMNPTAIIEDPFKSRRSRYYRYEACEVNYFVESPDGNDLFLLVFHLDSMSFGSKATCTMFKEIKSAGKWDLVRSLDDVFHVLGRCGTLFSVNKSQYDMVVKNLDRNHVGGSLRCVYDVNFGIDKSLRLPVDVGDIPYLWLTPTLD